MPHAIWVVLLCAAAQPEVDAELERRLYPDPFHGRGAGVSAVAAQDIDAVLERKLQEERDVARFRESVQPPLALPSGMWLQGGAAAPRTPQVAVSQPMPPRTTVGGELLLNGEPLPLWLRKDIEAREEALDRKLEKQRHVKTPGAIAGAVTQESLQLTQAPPQFAQAPPPPQREAGAAPGGAQAVTKLPADSTVSFVGELDDVSTDKVWIKDARGNLIMLSIGPETQAFQNGQQVDVLSLQEGRPVSVSFEPAPKQPVATSLIVLED